MIRRGAPILLAALLAGAAALGAAPPSASDALGPLGGRNMYAPHLPWYSFAAESAAPRPVDAVRIHGGIYGMNEFGAYAFDEDTEPLDPDGTLSDQDEFTALDYESVILEFGADWQATPTWRFRADWRIHARYGGVLDGIIEGWHGLFGLANAGREYFDRNRSAWSIESARTRDFTGDGPTVATGDLDLEALWSFSGGSRSDWALRGAFKIPTGVPSGGFGSGYPDLAAAVTVDWHPWKRWSVYAGAGLILPLGSGAFPMGQFFPAIEFRLNPGLSLLAQMNIQSSPIKGPPARRYVHPLFGSVDMFALPQTDVKIGLKGRSGRLAWQAYFEEDPLTWEGPDILMFFGASIDVGGEDL